MQKDADYVAKFSTYEDALKALQEEKNSNTEDSNDKSLSKEKKKDKKKE